MSLEAFAHITTVVTLMILVYVQAKPAINRWATIRYLRCRYEFYDDIFVTPREFRGLSRAKRLRRIKRETLRFAAFALIRRADLLRLQNMIPQLINESRRPRHLPVTDGCDPLVAEALFLSKHYLEDRKDRRRARVHRRVRCAGGCGTRFGKQRRDHDFFGGEGIYGGWHCPSTPCQRRATGDHYCGMCLEESRQASETPPLSDTKMILLDLEPHPEHPDLQDY